MNLIFDLLNSSLVSYYLSAKGNNIVHIIQKNEVEAVVTYIQELSYNLTIKSEEIISIIPATKINYSVNKC